VVGDRLPENYDPADAVTLADAVNADILTVGDPREILPDGEGTRCYLGPLDDHLDAINAADAYLVVGVDIKAAQEVPWSVFRGDRVIITGRSSEVYRSAAEDIPFSSTWMGEADSTDLESVVRSTIATAASPEPATVYGEGEEHPDPPIDLFANSDSSVPVKRCEVCHTLTNQKIAIGGGFPGPAIEWQCPAVLHRNHDRLQILLDRREQLDRRRRLYDETSETGRRALERVDEADERLTKDIESLRGWFDGRFDDIVVPESDLTDIEQFDEFKPTEIEYE